MPLIRETVDETPKNLKPFLFHGLELSWRGRSQAIGDCPFCGKEQKFYASVETGLWECKVCGKSGNPLTFLRHLHEVSTTETQAAAFAELVEDRGLLVPETLEAWKAAHSALTGEWLLPGYQADGKSVGQLYRWGRCPTSGKTRLLATTGFGHCLYGTHLYDPNKPEVWLLEGPWDAMTMWETLRLAVFDGDELSLCGNVGLSLSSQVNVLAVPSCKTFRPEWLSWFKGKKVMLFYDSDHPRTNNGSVFRDGWDGMRKAFGLLAAEASEVRVLRWGTEGFDPNLPSGYDVRDWLKTNGTTPAQRVKRLASLLKKVGSAPEDWTAAAARAGSGDKEVEPLECSSWKLLIQSCRAAWKWTDGQDHASATMLAVCLSTEQVGDQLFLQVIGDAGSGKTQLCDGLLVSKFCHPVESVKGFLSGWRANEGKDYSLLNRINMKTAVTPEGDVMMSSPEFAQLMSQQRRMFDGAFTQSYKTLNEDRRYTGLRTPWIMAGTLTLLSADQSRLGDRFLKVFIPRPTEDEEDDILDQVFHTAKDVVRLRSNGKPDSTKEENLMRAQRLLGGYVDYLRTNAEELLTKVRVNVDLVKPVVKACARFVADVRARPDPNRFREEKHDTKEMPTRLTHQLTRLAMCLAVVLDKREVDEEVLRRVRRVALDTAYGQTLEVVRRLYRTGRKGHEQGVLSAWTGHSEERETKLLAFLKKIDVVEPFRLEQHQGLSVHVRWRLTRRCLALCEVVRLGETV